MKRLITLAVAVVASVAFSLPAAAQSEKAANLDQLLKQVKQRNAAQRKENKQREAEFLKKKNQQAKMLADARARLAGLQKQSEELERTFQDNEQSIADLEAKLAERVGTMGELFGVVRQVAGDARSHVLDSLVSAQIPDRAAPLDKLAQSKGLPSIEQLENLWIGLQTEMTEQGKVVDFPATVTTPDGETKEARVVRVGVFTAVSDGKYLLWNGSAKKLQILASQPSRRHLSAASKLQAADDGFVRMSVDPSRGNILRLLVETPGFFERLQYGGVIGYIIIALGLLALALALWRLTALFGVRRKVQAQERAKAVSGDNPLGRILQVGDDHKRADPETLELKLDEAILKEESGLEKYLWAVKVVSVAAPLMGLLGTVTGMIRTFQAITLFGTGDPKLMAGGISEALVTTMLGLTVAIPLVLIYSWVTSISKQVMEVLEERSAGLIALRTEKTIDASA